MLQVISIGFMLICLLSSPTAGLDWRDLDLSDENSALRK